MDGTYRRDSHYIDGRWRTASSSEAIDVLEPGTGQLLGTVPAGTADDVGAAVNAADAAAPGWARVAPAQRAQILARISEGIRRREQALARTVTREMGMPLAYTPSAQVASAAYQFDQAAQLLPDALEDEKSGSAVIRREPVGVVAAITPWNFPLYQLALKVAPALAAGCAVVAKPSELSPFSAYELAEIIDDAGLPAGVFNLVSGTGDAVGEPLVCSDRVDMVTFTGSTAAGRRVSALASNTVKRVTLELGGKSPNIVLDGADLTVVVNDAVAEAFYNSGQTCSALTRLIVPRHQLAVVEELAVAAAAGYELVDPLGAAGGLGPLVSARQRDRVLDYIGRGISEGAVLLTGSPQPPSGWGDGYYVAPTVLSQVAPRSVVATEEIFGPVLVIIGHDGVEDAIAIANDSIYGLAAGVWAADLDDATRVAERLRAGMVRINGGQFAADAPFGGYRQSGNGRENGRYGLEEFVELKAMLY